MIGDIWEHWAPPTNPPKGIIIIAYGYYDEEGTMFVGTSDEIFDLLLNHNNDNNFMWRLSGIGKYQLEERGA